MLVDALSVRPRTRVRFPPPPLSQLVGHFRSEHLVVRGLDRNGCPQLVAVDLVELLLKIGGRALDVDVRCGAHVGVPEQLAQAKVATVSAPVAGAARDAPPPIPSS